MPAPSCFREFQIHPGFGPRTDPRKDSLAPAIGWCGLRRGYLGNFVDQRRGPTSSPPGCGPFLSVRSGSRVRLIVRRRTGVQNFMRCWRRVGTAPCACVLGVKVPRFWAAPSEEFRLVPRGDSFAEDGAKVRAGRAASKRLAALPLFGAAANGAKLSPFHDFTHPPLRGPLQGGDLLLGNASRRVPSPGGVPAGRGGFRA